MSTNDQTPDSAKTQAPAVDAVHRLATGAGVISLLGARQKATAQPLEEISVEALSAVQSSAADEVAQIREEAGAIVRSESLF